MNEKTLYESHPAMFRSNPIGFVLSILLIPFMGLGLLILLIWWLKCIGAMLTLTDERSTLRTGILSRNISEVYHSDVRNVQINQGLFQRLFGVGTVAISSAGQAGMEIIADGMPNPNKVKEIIDTYRRQHRG